MASSSFPNELISAYLDGELTADERSRVEQALLDDADLRRMYDELRMLRATVQSLPLAHPTAGLAERVLRKAERRMVLGSDEPRDTVDSKPLEARFDGATSSVPPRRSMKGWWVAVAAIASAAALLVVALSLPRTPHHEAASTAVAKADIESSADAATREAAPAAAAPAEHDSAASDAVDMYKFSKAGTGPVTADEAWDYRAEQRGLPAGPGQEAGGSVRLVAPSQPPTDSDRAGSTPPQLEPPAAPSTDPKGGMGLGGGYPGTTNGPGGMGGASGGATAGFGSHADEASRESQRRAAPNLKQLGQEPAEEGLRERHDVQETPEMLDAGNPGAIQKRSEPARGRQKRESEKRSYGQTVASDVLRVEMTTVDALMERLHRDHVLLVAVAWPSPPLGGEKDVAGKSADVGAATNQTQAFLDQLQRDPGSEPLSRELALAQQQTASAAGEDESLFTFAWPATRIRESLVKMADLPGDVVAMPVSGIPKHLAARMERTLASYRDGVPASRSMGGEHEGEAGEPSSMLGKATDAESTTRPGSGVRPGATGVAKPDGLSEELAVPPATGSVTPRSEAKTSQEAPREGDGPPTTGQPSSADRKPPQKKVYLLFHLAPPPANAAPPPPPTIDR
ncbi:MAG: hypothetical protein FJ276_25265 [Planctomycetes bacterium]|nr:hypothetical protein [Planctomycetota bacterium]